MPWSRLIPGLVLDASSAESSSPWWRATQQDTGAPVLTRYLPLADDADVAGGALADVHAGIEVVANLAHPHLLPITEVVSCPNGVAIVTPLPQGGSLMELLDARSALPEGEAVTVCGPIAQALAHAHAHGHVHGALTPDDIWFTLDGRPMLGGIGLAALRHVQADPPPPRRSPRAVFTAPEVMRGEPYSAAADVYALAAVARFAATGQAPRAGQPGFSRRGGPSNTLLSAAAEANRRPRATVLANALFALADPEPVELPARADGETPPSAPDSSSLPPANSPAESATSGRPDASVADGDALDDDDDDSLLGPLPIKPVRRRRHATARGAHARGEGSTRRSQPSSVPGPQAGSQPGSLQGSVPGATSTPERDKSPEAPGESDPDREVEAEAVPSAQSQLAPRTESASEPAAGPTVEQDDDPEPEPPLRGKPEPSLEPDAEQSPASVAVDDTVRGYASAADVAAYMRASNTSTQAQQTGRRAAFWNRAGARRDRESRRRDQGGSRRLDPTRVVLLIVVPVLLAGAAFAGYQWFSSEPEVPTAERTAEVSVGEDVELCGGRQPAPTEEPPEVTNWTATLQALYDLRSDAYADLDAQALCQVYAPTSEQLAQDVTHLQEYAEADVRTKNLHFEVINAELARREGSRVVLEVTDSWSAYQLVDPDGNVVEEKEGMPQDTWEVVLVPAPDASGWRLS